jgi:hypothetical protein
VYAPALVAWVGGGVGVSVSVGSAPVGWFPLAPREVYVPAYRASPRYVREVNVTHVTNVTNITTVINNRNVERDFENRKFPHAVTVVPAEVIARRQPVAPAAARMRSDPQVREIVANAAPAQIMTAPPVTAPQAAARPPQGNTAPRPPFEARGRGGFAVRPDTGQAPRPEAGRSPEPRFEQPRGDATRPGGATPPAAAAMPPTANATPAAGPPVRARGPLVEPSNEQPGSRGIPGRQGGPSRDGAAPAAPTAVAPAPAVVAPAPAAVVPPSPVQRNAQSNDAQGRPGYRGREFADDDRGGPKAGVIPGQRNNAMRDGRASPRSCAAAAHQRALPAAAFERSAARDRGCAPAGRRARSRGAPASASAGGASARAAAAPAAQARAGATSLRRNARLQPSRLPARAGAA